MGPRLGGLYPLSRRARRRCGARASNSSVRRTATRVHRDGRDSFGSLSDDDGGGIGAAVNLR